MNFFNVAMNMILILMTDLKTITDACFNIRDHQSHVRTTILKTNSVFVLEKFKYLCSMIILIT